MSQLYLLFQHLYLKDKINTLLNSVPRIPAHLTAVSQYYQLVTTRSASVSRIIREHDQDRVLKVFSVYVLRLQSHAVMTFFTRTSSVHSYGAVDGGSSGRILLRRDASRRAQTVTRATCHDSFESKG
jgi:hypothetical protein